jgi:hypothetical protein
VRHGPQRVPHRRRTPNQGKKPAINDESPIFPGTGGIIECGLRAPRSWNRDLRGTESGRRRYRINFTRFRKRMRQPRGENAPQRSDLASRPPVPIAERLGATETTEPGNMRPNARYRILAVREERARRSGASKCPRRNLNLPLAAGARVRHIRADGAVAEWLKAAVC